MDKLEIIEKESDRIINFVFNECHIYLSTKFKPSYLAPEFNGEYKRYANKLRWEWLYKNYGYVNEINKFSSEFVRINEYIGFQDYPSSLRHKIFIINSLLENNMNTFVPAHVSITPTSLNKANNIDIEELSNSIDFFEVICHPGFTRGIGSTFLNTPLKKVLVYIKKEHNLKLKETAHLKEIKNKKELLSIYKSTSTEKELTYDFRIFKGETKDNVKYHVPGNIPILKVNNILTKDFKRVHHTDHYKSYTFETFNEYCKILFSNKIKIFTDINNKDNLIKQFKNNATKLQTDIFGIDFKWRDKNYTIKDAQNKADFNGIIAPNIAFSHIPDSKYAKAYKAYWMAYRELFETPEESNFIINDHFMGGAKIIEERNKDVKKLVKSNNHKGLIIYISKDITNKIERLFYELLFCISYNISITQTKCKNLQIINCSHPYWKNEAEYKEAILEDSFLSYE